jgi:hypothetical protein
MKLHDRAPTAAETVHPQDVRKLSNASTATPATNGANASSDRVEFSGNLGRLARALSTYGTSRANRVQALAAQYQSGNYRPDSSATSQAMVRAALVAGTQLDPGHDGVEPAAAQA